ncbi:MAG TPA: NUDIX domain-containing protein [Xanthobacteraceae bacterium]|nr:NUDIX domain-containing protein [Xanthobacteraceae bacterium]
MIEVHSIDRVEVAIEPWDWDFADNRRAEIGRHFAERQRARPALWNGRVLLLNRYAVTDGVLRGACFETDFASFLAWRDWDFPDPGVFNIFAAAALQSADGAYLVGEMAPSTAAGQIYFPCGTPDPRNVGGGKLDLDDSLHRELLEETGIEIATLDVTPGWNFLRDRGFLALMKRVTARETADALRSRIMRNLENDSQPEFCDIRIVRGPGDLDPRMPRFVTAFLAAVWRQ